MQTNVPPTNVNEATALLSDLQLSYIAFIEHLPQIGIGLLLLIIFYFLSGPLSRLIVRPMNYAQTSLLVRVVTRRIVSLLIILLGLYLFLRMAGLSAFAVAILSGTGVVGLIIGFAFKDIAENFMSSLLLSIQKPFRIGEVIEVEGNLGVVKQVTARATTLVDFDGNHIQVPNANVYKNTIRNFTANPQTRGKFLIGIGYDVDPSFAQKLGLEVLAKIEPILNDPEPQILVNDLGSSTLNLMVYYWTDTSKFSLLKVSSLAMKSIVKAFDNAGISMPDDAREVVFPDGVPVIQQQNKDQAEDQTGDNNSTSSASNANKKPTTHRAQTIKIDSTEDLSSDDEDIRKQAAQARDPEQGNNIL